MKGIFIFLVFSVMLLSCKKEHQSFCLNAAVKWGGDPAADGLGWYIMDSVGGLKIIYRQICPTILKLMAYLYMCAYMRPPKNFTANASAR